MKVYWSSYPHTSLPAGQHACSMLANRHFNTNIIYTGDGLRPKCCVLFSSLIYALSFIMQYSLGTMINKHFAFKPQFWIYLY